MDMTAMRLKSSMRLPQELRSKQVSEITWTDFNAKVAEKKQARVEKDRIGPSQPQPCFQSSADFADSAVRIWK